MKVKKSRIFVKENPFPCPEYNEGRVDLYNQIVKRLLRKSSANRKDPIAIILAGPIAAGKSSVVNKFIKVKLNRDPNEFALISVDAATEGFPEYIKALDIASYLQKEDLEKLLKETQNSSILTNLDKYILTAETAALDCREEAKELTRNLLLPKIIEEKHDFIYDSTARNTRFYADLIPKLQKDGYTVYVVYVTSSLGVIQKRAETRAQEDGRFVDKETIKFLYNIMKKREIFSTLCRLADRCYLYNNQRGPVIVVEKDKNGILQCYDVKFLEGIVEEKDCNTLYN